MEKNEFVWILQSALLSFDGMKEEEIIELGVEPKMAKAGIKLCNYLKLN